MSRDISQQHDAQQKQISAKLLKMRRTARIEKLLESRVGDVRSSTATDIAVEL
jgi:hypothetical protein